MKSGAATKLIGLYAALLLLTAYLLTRAPGPAWQWAALLAITAAAAGVLTHRSRLLAGLMLTVILAGVGLALLAYATRTGSGLLFRWTVGLGVAHLIAAITFLGATVLRRDM